MSIEHSYDPDERRIEAMMDGSGFSREAAEIKLGKKVISGSSELPRSPKPARAPHPSGRVRDFESDRDHDLVAERASYTPLSDEQKEINARGLALIAAERRKLRLDNMHRRITEQTEFYADPDRQNEVEAGENLAHNAANRAEYDRRRQS